MENLRRFKETVVDEYGKKDGLKMFVFSMIEDLDRLADRHGKIDIFHITGNEIIDYYEDDEALTLEEFIKSLDLEEIEDKTVVETLEYLLEHIKKYPDDLPVELIEKLYKEL